MFPINSEPAETKASLNSKSEWFLNNSCLSLNCLFAPEKGDTTCAFLAMTSYLGVLVQLFQTKIFSFHALTISYFLSSM